MGQCEGASRGGGVSGSCRRVNRTLVSLILHRRNISLNAGSDLTIHLSVCLSVGCSTQLFDCIIRTVARQSITWRVTSLGASGTNATNAIKLSTVERWFPTDRTTQHTDSIYPLQQYIYAASFCTQQDYVDLLATLLQFTPQIYDAQRRNHRRSQDFVWGLHFFAKKVDDLFYFLVVALERLSKYTPKSS